MRDLYKNAYRQILALLNKHNERVGGTQETTASEKGKNVVDNQVADGASEGSQDMDLDSTCGSEGSADMDLDSD